jgi:hypothetical protein
MDNVVSLDTHRVRKQVKAWERVNDAFTRSLLREATTLVRSHFPEVKLRDAWVYRFNGDHWEFHGPDDFIGTGTLTVRITPATRAGWHGSKKRALRSTEIGRFAVDPGTGKRVNHERN